MVGHMYSSIFVHYCVVGEMSCAHDLSSICMHTLEAKVI